MKTFQSTPITFIDQTDSRKLEVYIKSNLPTVQIYNSNTGAYTPDWREGEKLTLAADVFLDSRVMTTAEYSGTLIKWYIDEVSDDTEITTNRNLRTLQITTNELETAPIITYICEATYQGIVASMRLTFARVDTGKDGEKGDDGTSIKIRGTADSVALVPETNYYTIVYSEGAIVAAALGDAYVYGGELYVCSVLDGEGTNDYFVNVGPIQGQKGEDAKSIVLSGNSQLFRVSKTNAVTPSTITVVAQTSNTTVTSWSYSTNGGQTFLSTTPSGVVRDGNIVTITGTTLTTNSLVIKASDGTIDDVFTVYKVSDGTDGTDGDKGDPAPLAFLTNENISFAANENGQVSLTTFTTNVVAYVGTTKATPVLGTITGLPSGMTVGTPVTTLNEVILTFSIANNSTLGANTSNSGTITIPVTSPVSTNLKLSWSKINTGHTGVGIKSTTVTYGISDSSTTQPTEWQSTIPTVAEGKYLWTRTIIDYTDESKPDTVTYIYAKQGEKGNPGNPGSSVTVSSIQYQEGTSATTAPTGTWSNAVVAVADGRYLWTKTTFSDDKIAYGVAKQGSAGTAASLVDITPSAMYFKSTTGSTGTFEPQYIYLYPRFQNATYSNWQYSLDGGTTWSEATGANGLSIGTYNSVANSLRIARGSTLYTSSITSISFKCNSTTTGVYDTVSIAKIYDVVDLQIGGRNWITNSGYMKTIDGWKQYHANYPVTDIAIEDNDVYGTVLTATGTAEISRLRIGNYIPFLEKFNRTLMFSMVYKADNLGAVYVGGKYSESDSSGEYGSFTGTTVKTQDLGNGFTYMESKITISPNANTRSFFIYIYTGIQTVKVVHCKLEEGDTVTDWSPAPEDLIEEASNINVMLSNESHFFEATAGGVPTETSVTLDVIGYKGSIRSATTVGTILGKPSAGMAVTILSNGTIDTKIKIDITSALTSDIADYGALTIPITVNGQVINKIFNWTKAKAGDVGASGSDAVTFQVYSNNGYALSTSVPTLTLQTFAYIGDIEIQAGATYQWYRNNDTDWVAVSGATNSYFNVSRDDVSFSNNYMCKMQFNGTEYVGVVTIDDKNDENKVFASKPSNYFAGDLWIVGTDYAPSGFTVGTMLRAEHTNSTYADSDWVAATKYDEEIGDLRDTVDSYKQYFSIDSTNGLRVGDASINNNTLTVDRIETTTIEAKEIEIESPLTVTGKYSGSTMQQAPIINIGNFSIVVESNGSLSIVANT